MPQINRIRVNNVKYNFGTQFYDDFLMRFSCRNTIYDLANGGGKSVLMLLMLQTIIPNCTLDEKQPVEKLFDTPTGSTTVHSLVEWKLDACDVKNGFKYMTCGFCARKAKNDAGDSSAAETVELSMDKSTDRIAGSGGIEYYNYCIFYREFGDNDIKNLPLVNGRERITYNGLKNYLKELEKKDFGVSVRIFERKGDYQRFIGEYGIYESQWELIRGINKTEGHVRTYFESNYKTTRKVVEDLFIEEIIEKSYNNQIRGKENDDEMAKTLLDIKDKLLELSRRRENMDSYNRQIELIKNFSGKVEDFAALYAEKEAKKTKLLACLSAAKAQSAAAAERTKTSEEEMKSLKDAVLREEKLIAMADIVQEEREAKQLSGLAEELESRLKELSGRYEECGRQLCMAQTAEDYRDYTEYGRTLAQLREYMENRNKDKSAVTEEMKRLAAFKHTCMQAALEKLDKEQAELEARAGEYREAVEKLREDCRRQDHACARAEGALAGLKEQAALKEESIKKYMNQTSLLVSDRASEEADNLKTKIKELTGKQKVLDNEAQELRVRLDYNVKEEAAAKAELSFLEGEMKRLADDVSEAGRRAEEIASLCKVYDEAEPRRLLSSVGKIYERMLVERDELYRSRKRQEAFVSAIENKRPEDMQETQQVYEYLESRYGGKVLSGARYLDDKTEEECARLTRLYPYLPYSVLVKEDYELICGDKNMMGIGNGAVVPVLDRTLLEDDEAVQGPYLACRDISFIYDEAGRQAGLRLVKEETERIGAEILKIDSRLAVVREDYEKLGAFVRTGGTDVNELEEQYDKAKREFEELKKKEEKLCSLRENLSEREGELSERRTALAGLLSQTEKERELLLDIAGLNEELNLCLAQIKERQADKEKNCKAKKLSEELLDGKENAYRGIMLKQRQNEEEILALKRRWEAFAPYYEPQEEKEQDGCGISEEEADARFDALRELLFKDVSKDLSDKEQLMENCRAGMARLERAMQYRGILPEQARKLWQAGELVPMSDGDIARITAEQEKLRGEIASAKRELESAGAQKNRLEGSAAYAVKAFKERYGVWETVEETMRESAKIVNSADFLRQHKEELARVKQLSSQADTRGKENAKLCTEYKLMEKDLERLVKSMGIDPDSVAAGGPSTAFTDGKSAAEEYEEAGKSFERVIREETKRKEAFLRERDMLAETLAGLNAYELAQEMKRSVSAPDDGEAARELQAALKDTAECIVLERERIGRGIEDMERIKENFENRCLQICCNIRAELERLPKLSRITMDDETIPILSLHIPYIKEDMYKDRMSVYINETAAIAENFKTGEERLKYIKGRLTWKRLFSVIVTDMNSIRLNLYKRERIKDQSRYLRYEEAVGSTGQSQGIYIQFLVAVINYIASINAKGKEASVLGKTVFIDNPFGAAKDIYIWEPIFKLLKTNHVQLIVPARGATPAITGRFDVNYVLGQRMAQNRQQTVVTDYRSQTADEELEYERLSFSQESFDFPE